jgi:hypothetical protein
MLLKVIVGQPVVEEIRATSTSKVREFACTMVFAPLFKLRIEPASVAGVVRPFALISDNLHAFAEVLGSSAGISASAKA